jgi:hypothetical protein
MTTELVVTMVPTRSETRLLVTLGRDEVMKARLGPAMDLHRLAAPMLLEALALWYQRRVYAVISADADAISSDLGLSDRLGGGVETVHYEVEWVHPRERRPRAVRVRGLGDFRDVRRHLRLVWSR